MKRPVGKRAIVTGAGRGVGPDFAEVHAPEGGTVAIADIDVMNATSTAGDEWMCS